MGNIKKPIKVYGGNCSITLVPYKKPTLLARIKRKLKRLANDIYRFF